MVDLDTMRHRSLIAGIAALLIGGGLACTSHRPVPAPAVREPQRESYDNGEDITLLMVEAHNAERSRKRLPPVRLNRDLSEAAGRHASDMASRGKMSHTGGDRSSPFDRMTRAGYAFSRAGENVAAGQRDVPEVMNDWMHSSGHRRNILGDFSEMGAARVTASDGTSYWCATFGRPAGR